MKGFGKLSWRFLVLPVLGLAVLPAACCPSGVFVDNFNSLYQILTAPPPLSGLPFQTSGWVDTRGLGCGVWNVRAPLPGEPYDPQYAVVFYAENPTPDPNDNCCYGFRFDGNQQTPECRVVSGAYSNVGGKCTASGSMTLQAVVQ